MWSEEETKFLIDNYLELGPKVTAKKLGRTKSSVTSKASRLGLTKTINSKKFSKEEIDFLENNYNKLGPTACSIKLKRTYDSVISKASRMKLYSPSLKSDEVCYVYLCYFPDLKTYKVGVTNNWARRKNRFNYPCKTIKVTSCANREIAKKLEKEILNLADLLDTGLLNSGNTETFIAP